EGAGPGGRAGDRREESSGGRAELRDGPDPDRHLLPGRAPDVRGSRRPAHPGARREAAGRPGRLPPRRDSAPRGDALARTAPDPRTPNDMLRGSVGAIELRDVRRLFRATTGTLRRHTKEIVALGGLSLDVGEGELFGILGPNGAGKIGRAHV